MLDQDEMLQVRQIATIVAQDVLIETLKGMSTVSGHGSATSSGEQFVVTSKEFKGANPERVEEDINDWLRTMGATEIHHTDSIKDPASNFGVIKTIYIKVPASKLRQE